jgi:endonuclease G
MPGLGPSLVFAAGLAIGIGAGTYIPKKSNKDVGVLPPPPVEKYDVVKKLPTATGSAILQGGFPGMLNNHYALNMAD